ncbi:MAG: ACP S-malonyltransferase [Puniceicoccales bacterium]|jgi:[acyl-carrier-protein] S-malonyltransferase|nr:ACP S-malonyltransferase [Puniceicoccales bacterium]
MKKIGLLFPGQGTQVVGMGRSLVEHYETAAKLFYEASAILGYDLEKLCFEGPIEVLTKSRYCQPALFVHQFAAAQVLGELIGKDAIALAMGLSIGEVTALAWAEVFDFKTGVRIVQKRGDFIQYACEITEGGMVSILGTTSDCVKKLCALYEVEISNINGPGQIVLAGEKEKIQRVFEATTEITGGKAVLLNVGGAFHCSLMEPAREQFEEFLKKVKFKAPRIKVVSNVTGEVMKDPERIKNLLAQQITSPVQWWECMQTAQREGIHDFYECGAGQTLANIAKRIDDEFHVLSFGEYGNAIKFES